MAMTVFCPTRGRPDAAWQLLKTFNHTKERDDTTLVFVIDEDDPELHNYLAPRNGHELLIAQPKHEGGMVNALNAAVAQAFVRRPDEREIGFVGDDHRFRTKGWDETFHTSLSDRPGFVYGNDLFWPNGEIPTQIFISGPILKRLGWMGLPGCHHLFIDNAWKELGELTGTLRYYRDVVIEHMHPAGGKAVWDEGHLRVNTPEMYGHDGAVFEQWRNGPQFLEDINRVRMALGSVFAR